MFSFPLQRICWCGNNHELYSSKFSYKPSMRMYWIYDLELKNMRRGSVTILCFPRLSKTCENLSMCARQLLLSTRILCSLARPELGAAPMKRWITGSPGLVAFLFKVVVVVCSCEGAHVFFFLLMLPRYLMVHGRKGLTQPESSPFFFFILVLRLWVSTRSPS